jgi:peptidoglycan/xylan/chitin deacetylase (PgdA/CDA1 family)
MQKILILLLSASLSLFAHPAGAAEKLIVITVDDLPAWGDQSLKVLKPIADELSASNVPATGFVIGKLAQGEEALKSIHYWAAKGLSLANHSWDHKKYSNQTVQDFFDGIQKTEDILKRIRKNFGPWPQAYRFPMLDQGDTEEKLMAANEYFFKSKTLLAHVSVDTSDWAFAEHYAKFIKQTDSHRMAKLESLYIDHIFDCLNYAEDASERIFDGQIPQILLLHANFLNAKMMGDIVKGLKNRGYKFVSLEVALNHPAYLPYKYKIAYQPADHFFFHMSHVLQRPLPSGPDRTSYRYFQNYWEKKILAP